MKKLITLLLLMSFSAVAADEPTITLNKNDFAPFDGFLINKERGQRISWLQIDYDTLKKIDDLKDQEIQTLNQNLVNVKQENQDTKKELNDSNNLNSWKQLGCFTLGVLTAVATAFAINHAIK